MGSYRGTALAGPEHERGVGGAADDVTATTGTVWLLASSTVSLAVLVEYNGRWHLSV